MALTDKERELANIREQGALARSEITEAVESAFRAEDGPTEKVVRAISAEKKEPEWMLNFRLNALDRFIEKPLPSWGPSLEDIDFEHLSYYVKPLADDESETERTWDDVPEAMKKTYDRLGVPRAEAEALAGVSNQWDSEVVFHDLKEKLKEQGVIFLDMDSGLREHEDLVREHFGTVIPAGDNKFAALNSAFWSGGCLTKNARINTPKAIRSIEDISSGEMVYALNEKGLLEEREVLAKVNNGVKETFLIEVGGRQIEATSNHPFLTLNKSDKIIDKSTGRKWYLKWKPLRDIKEKDLVALALDIPSEGKPFCLPKLKPDQKNKPGPNKTTEDLMWLLGTWVGYGSNSWTENTCQIKFALPEKSKSEVRAEAIHLLKNIFGYEVTSNEDSFEVESKALRLWMKEIGFDGNTEIKRIPEWVWGLSRNQKMAFLGGLLDSNGWLESQAKTFKIELFNKKLIEDINSLAISCGLYSSSKILKRDRTNTFLRLENDHTKKATLYSCKITGTIADIKSRNPDTIKALRSGNLGKRTVKKYRATTTQRFLSMTTDHLGFAPLKFKKSIGKKEVFDIQVEGLSNFVANGIISHNSFVWAPPGVQINQSLQTYFRINSKAMMQAERTLIIASPGSKVSYLEGCSAQGYSAQDSLHAAVVELIAMPDSEINYFTAQNWDPSNVWNMVTKRARAEKNSTVRWIQGELGSKLNLKYPSVYLVGEGAHAEILSVAFAGKGQNQDTGGKAVHLASNTTSQIISKSISSEGGIASYRGLLEIAPGAKDCRSRVVCDALILDSESSSNTWPTIRIGDPSADVGHEATVSKVGDEQLFYLMSRGISETEASAMIVNGFVEPIIKEMPLEYAVEINRLIELQMEGSIG